MVTNSVCVCVFLVYRKGYEAASKDFEPQDLDVSVVGRSFMITGANSGIGRATAMAIAKKGSNLKKVKCSLSCRVVSIQKKIPNVLVSRWDGPHGV